MTITLPLPSRILSPNSRGHWAKKARATKTARSTAYWTTINAIRGDGSPVDMPTVYRLRFYWRDRRRRDDDNAAASCKAYRDGIADALGIDDHGLRLGGAPEMLHCKEDPRLEIELA